MLPPFCLNKKKVFNFKYLRLYTIRTVSSKDYIHNVQFIWQIQGKYTIMYPILLCPKFCTQFTFYKN